MLSRTHRLGLFLSAATALASCGFAPAFGTDGPATGLRNAVQTQTPNTVMGFKLRARIDDRLGYATAGRYRLDVTLTDRQDAATVNPDGNTTRFQLTGQADWALMQGESLIADGRAENFTSYSATGSTVATQAAADDAANRLAILLADEIVTDLMLLGGDLP